MATAANRDAASLELTMPLLQRYNGVRTSLLRAMVQSPDLARRVLGAVGRAGGDGVEGPEIAVLWREATMLEAQVARQAFAPEGASR